MKTFFKSMTIKKWILIGIMIAAMFFMTAQREAFNKDYTYNFGPPADERQEQSLIDHPEILETFTAEKEQLKQISLKFENVGRDAARGSVVVQIRDKNGTALASASQPIAQVRTDNRPTLFDVNITLDSGETYTIAVLNDQIYNENGVFLYEGHKEIYTGFSYRNLFMVYAFLLIGIILVAIPLDDVSRKLNKNRDKEINLHVLISRILFFASPIVAYWVVEKFSGYPLSKFLSGLFSLTGLLNIFIYAFIWWLLYAILNRTKYTSLLLCLLGFVFGFINYLLTIFRGCPLVATDFSALGTAMNVAATYQLTFNLSALWAITYTVIFCCLVLCLNSYKGLHWKKRIVFVAVWIGLAFTFNSLFFRSSFIKDHGIRVSVWEPKRNYFKNGSALSFVVTLSYFVVEKPDGYSADAAKEIASKYPSDKGASKTSDTKKPNVICIMNEAFSDLSVIKQFETSEDYMPYIHSLKKNTVKGNLYVSCFGGTTANTEFEFLTGNSMAFFPFRSIPYNNYIKETIPSLTYTLDAQNYSGGKAVHPFRGNGWNRDVVYPFLGFKDFLTIDDFESPKYIRNYISDETDFDKLIEEYEKSKKDDKDDPFYIFNVTMQNHGGYNESLDTVKDVVEIKDSAIKTSQAELYLSVVKESDAAFKKLTDYFKSVDEPTIIVMFGDHQPKIPDEFYEALYGKPLDSLTLEETARMYQSAYVIWANYDIPSETKDMSANYLSSNLLELMGADMTGYNKYLLELQKKVPILSSICYIGDDGKMYSPGEKSKYSPLLNEYQILQYNNMFDSKKRISDFFFIEEPEK
ncbi:LTA synthase family protein [Anaerovorax odorimutans]|uniref:LTA synthase family protein n=1 Tax=Anaerovorax odorimutans TaxID=109327 RepID=A0ABT1RJC2_9FIRM|nr:LTA synthase family protein [Anaerovorax odorimutans]MCQ4635263.1 LTA synthase family protein [Anaerovorax odorimutans]